MGTRLDTDLLRTFVAIADSGSFTRAAENVRRTQSAVSMQIKKLEDIVGQPLFTRWSRGVRLTDAGETLLPNARRILRLLDETTDGFQTEPLEGDVRIGIPEEYGSTVLPRLLAQFADSHPNVNVTVTCEQTGQLERALETGTLDLAILVIDSGIASGELLIEDPTVWVTSTRHTVHEQEPLPLAMFELGCWWRDFALKALDDLERLYRVAYTSASVTGIQAAVSTGLAVAVMGQSTMPPGTRMLTQREGFTDLPGSSVVLRRNPDATSAAITGMATQIREAFHAMGLPASLAVA